MAFQQLAARNGLQRLQVPAVFCEHRERGLGRAEEVWGASNGGRRGEELGARAFLVAPVQQPRRVRARQLRARHRDRMRRDPHDRQGAQVLHHEVSSASPVCRFVFR